MTGSPRIRQFVAVAACMLFAGTSYAQQLTPWTVAGNMSSSRSFGTATRLNDGRVLFTGGASDPDFPPVVVATVDIYNPATGTVVAGPPLSEAKFGHVAVRLADGRVWVGGGFDASSDALVSAEIFDPATDTWSAAADLPTARGLAMAVALADGRVLVAGGQDNSYLSTVDIYDPADGVLGSWASAAPMSAAHYFGGITTLPDGRVLVAYGQTNDPASNGNSPFLQTAEVYDPAVNSWSPTATPSFAAGFLGGLMTLADGRAAFISAIGDLFDATTVGVGLDIYSPGTNSWSAGGPIPSPLLLSATAQLPDGRVLVAGGYDLLLGEDSTVTKVWDPVTDTWTAGPPLIDAHAGTRAIVLTSGKILVAGTYTSESARLEISNVNYPPVANAGPDVTASTCDSCVNAVLVNASASSDPNGDALTYSWTDGATTLLTTTSAIATIAVPPGTTMLTLVVSDPFGGEDSDEVSVTIVNVEDAWRAQVEGLLDDLEVCEAGGGGGAAVADFGAFLAAAFGDPGFTIPGATPADQLQSLINALKGLNHGQQLAIYSGLGGKPGMKK